MRSDQLSAISYQLAAGGMRRLGRSPVAKMGAVGLVCVLIVTIARGQGVAETSPATQTASGPAVRFEAVDVFVDSGSVPLAAWQFELTAEAGEVAIVGIEGGEHQAFADPPYYDPAAMRHDRVIVAAFNTGTDLPTGRTRVARLHVQITGATEPVYGVYLKVAASTDGQRIDEATIEVAQGEAR